MPQLSDFSSAFNIILAQMQNQSNKGHVLLSKKAIANLDYKDFISYVNYLESSVLGIEDKQGHINDRTKRLAEHLRDNELQNHPMETIGALLLLGERSMLTDIVYRHYQHGEYPVLGSVFYSDLEAYNLVCEDMSNIIRNKDYFNFFSPLIKEDISDNNQVFLSATYTFEPRQMDSTVDSTFWQIKTTVNYADLLLQQSLSSDKREAIFGDKNLEKALLVITEKVKNDVQKWDLFDINHYAEIYQELSGNPMLVKVGLNDKIMNHFGNWYSWNNSENLEHVRFVAGSFLIDDLCKNTPHNYKYNDQQSHVEVAKGYMRLLDKGLLILNKKTGSVFNPRYFDDIGTVRGILFLQGMGAALDECKSLNDDQKMFLEQLRDACERQVVLQYMNKEKQEDVNNTLMRIALLVEAPKSGRSKKMKV